MHGDQRERVRSSTAKLPLPTRLAPVNAAAAAVARGKEQRRHGQKAGLVSVYASKGLPMPSPTSYHGGPSGLLVLLRRRRDVLADLLGDVRREHAVVEDLRDNRAASTPARCTTTLLLAPALPSTSYRVQASPTHSGERSCSSRPTTRRFSSSTRRTVSRTSSSSAGFM